MDFRSFDCNINFLPSEGGRSLVCDISWLSWLWLLFGTLRLAFHNGLSIASLMAEAENETIAEARERSTAQRPENPTTQKALGVPLGLGGR